MFSLDMLRFFLQRQDSRKKEKIIFDINELSNARDADDDGDDGAEETDGKDEVARRSLGKS